MKPEAVIELFSIVKDNIHQAIITRKSAFTTLLSDNKIHVSILKGDKGQPAILTKLIKVSTEKPKPRLVFTPEFAERIKAGKKTFKSNLDAQYLFIVLERARVYASKLNAKDLTPEGVAIFRSEFTEVITALNQINKQLEYKGGNDETA